MNEERFPVAGRSLRLFLASCCALWGAQGLLAADGEAERARRGGESLVSNWHLGPFFEYRRTAPGDASFWAVRPFYSQVRDPATDTSVYDAVWPLATLHDHKDASWWRALIAYGDARATDPTWSFDIFPFWFSGADRKDDGYWGFFPFYGHHPHFLLMDDWTFALWPLWHTYTVKDVRSHAVLWPFITWRDEPRAGLGVWPFYGYNHQRESLHHYVLWPFVTWASYDEDRDTSGAGSSWWFFPFYGEVRRARESQTIVFPIGFSYTTADNSRTKAEDTTRWRLFWPFIESLHSPSRDRLSVFPFWEQVTGYAFDEGRPAEEQTWRVGWQLIENTKLETANSVEKRFNFFPFFTWERRWFRGPKTAEPDRKAAKAARTPIDTDAEPDDSYFRIWPFWSSETVRGRTRSRTLELMPIRHSEGVERNWAPFWSLWERDDRPDGRTRHSIFFNLVHWQTEPSS